MGEKDDLAIIIWEGQFSLCYRVSIIYPLELISV